MPRGLKLPGAHTQAGSRGHPVKSLLSPQSCLRVWDGRSRASAGAGTRTPLCARSPLPVLMPGCSMAAVLWPNQIQENDWECWYRRGPHAQAPQQGMTCGPWPFQTRLSGFTFLLLPQIFSLCAGHSLAFPFFFPCQRTLDSSTLQHYHLSWAVYSFFAPTIFIY